MPTNTTNYGLKKPADAEFGWQQMQRDNTDTIDTNLNRVDQQVQPEHNADGTHGIINADQVIVAGNPIGAIDSGTATGGSAATLIDTGKAWGVNQLAGALLVVQRAGATIRTETIVSNAADTTTVASGTAIAAGDSYSIYGVGNPTLDQVLSAGSDNGMIGNINDPLVQIPFKRASDETRLSGVQTFTRSTTGTYIDPLDGLLKTAAIDTPRFERMADGGIGVLLEGSSANLLTASDTIVSWASVSVTATANTGTAPDNTTTANTITSTVNGGQPCILSSAVPGGGAVTGRTFTASTWAKSASGATIRVWFYDGGVVELGNYVDVPLTTTWQRISVTGTFASTTSSNVIYRLQIVGASIGTAIDVWGMQLEELPFASSYIATTSGSVTRAADLLTIPVVGNTQDPQSKALTMMADFDVLGLGVQHHLWSILPIQHFISRVDTSGLLLHYGGTGPNINAAIAASTVYRTGVVMFDTQYATFLDRVPKAMIAKSYGAYVAPTTIYIGSWGAGNKIFGHIRNLRIYDKALTDTEIAAA